jgi:hypothetical protein
MRDNGDEVNATAEDFNYPAADTLVGFLLLVWSTLGMLEDVTAPYDVGTAQVASGSS